MRRCAGPPPPAPLIPLARWRKDEPGRPPGVPPPEPERCTPSTSLGLSVLGKRLAVPVLGHFPRLVICVPSGDGVAGLVDGMNKMAHLGWGRKKGVCVCVCVCVRPKRLRWGDACTRTRPRRGTPAGLRRASAKTPKTLPLSGACHGPKSSRSGRGGEPPSPGPPGMPPHQLVGHARGRLRQPALWRRLGTVRPLVKPPLANLAWE